MVASAFARIVAVSGDLIALWFAVTFGSLAFALHRLAFAGLAAPAAASTTTAAAAASASVSIIAVLLAFGTIALGAVLVGADGIGVTVGRVVPDVIIVGDILVFGAGTIAFGGLVGRLWPV